MSTRVLLIEDDDVARGIMRDELAAAGFAVAVVDSGEGALAAMDAEPGAFAAIVCDVALPGMSGPIAIGKAPPASLGKAALLFLSGFGEADLSAFKGVRAAASLKKPIVPGALTQAVQGLIAAGA